MNFLPRNVIVVTVSIFSRAALWQQMRWDLMQCGSTFGFFGRFFSTIIGMHHDDGTVVG
jgi:hypothetical protein